MIPPVAIWNDVSAVAETRGPHQDVLQLTLTEGYDAFLALEAGWNELHERASAPHQHLQSYNWLWHWCRHARHDSGTQFVVLAGQRAGRTVIIWPMVRRRRLGIRVLGFMATAVSPYCDALVESGPDAARDIAAAWQHLARHGGTDAIDLDNVREDARLAHLVRSLGLAPVREEVACSLDLTATGSWAAFEASQPAKARKNRRRQRRRLEEQGDVRFEVVCEGERARALMRQAIAMKRAWMQRKCVVSTAFAVRWFEAFSADVAGCAAHTTGCRIGCLTLSGKPVAIAVGFVHKGHLSLHVVAYDDAVETCAPGSLLFEEMLRYAFAEGYGSFDLMWPGAAYKAEFAPQQTHVRNYSVAVTPLGAMHTAVAPRIRAGLKAAYSALPPAARRIAAPLLGRR